MKTMRCAMIIVSLLLLDQWRSGAAQMLTTLHNFTRGIDGESPHGLIEGTDGDFYGTTFGGGTSNNGVVFKITAAGTLTTLHSFTGGADGFNPHGLIQGSDSNFYGATFGSGASGNYGTVFKISTSGTLTALYRFTGGMDGRQPNGPVQGSDGNFYDTTEGESTNGDFGTVFKISPTGSLTTLFSFTGAADGGAPAGALVQSNDGNCYGTTSAGGADNAGTVFKISPTGALTTLYNFTNETDGGGPLAALIQGNAGNFYGTTPGASGEIGTNDFGTVFEISPTGMLTTLYSFKGGADGNTPNGLIQDALGNFYGATAFGGESLAGTVFAINPAGRLTTLYRFPGLNDGSYPDGSIPTALVLGQDGNLYGTTLGGGTNGAGTIFKLDIHVGSTNTLPALWSKVKRACKIKKDVTVCALSGLLTVINKGTATLPPVQVRFFLSSEMTFNPGVDPAEGEVTTKPIKAGKSTKCKLRATTTDDVSGWFILAVDKNNNIMAAVPVP